MKIIPEIVENTLDSVKFANQYCVFKLKCIKFQKVSKQIDNLTT